MTAASSRVVRDRLARLIFQSWEKKIPFFFFGQNMSVSQRFSHRDSDSIIKLTIDSQNSDEFPSKNPHTYTKRLPNPIKAVNAISIDSIVIPNTWSVIDKSFYNEYIRVELRDGFNVTSQYDVWLEDTGYPVTTGARLATRLQDRLNADTPIVWTVTFDTESGYLLFQITDPDPGWTFRFLPFDVSTPREKIRNNVYTLIGFSQKIIGQTFSRDHLGYHVDLQPLHVIHLDFGKGWHQCFNDLTNTGTQAIISLDENASHYNVWTNKDFAKQLFFFNPSETTLDTLTVRLLTPTGEPVPFRGGHWTMTLSVDVISGHFGTHASPLLYQQ